MPRTDYDKSKRVNLSRLNLLEESPQSYLYPVRKEEDYFDIGTAVDTLVTCPKEWKDTVIVYKGDSPTSKLKEVVREIVKQNVIEDDVEIVRVARELEYQKNYIDATLVKKIRVFDKYMKLYSNAQEENMIILSPKQSSHCKSLAKKVLDNPYTGQWFESSKYARKDCIFFDQLAIYWDITVADRKFECKSLLDGVVIDTKEKKIYPIDLKTTSKGIDNFSYSFFQYRYFRQASFYSTALLWWINNDSIGREFKDFKIEPFKFVVVDKYSQDPAAVFTVSDLDLHTGSFGGTFNNKKVKGFIQLIEELAWHLLTDNWKVKKSYEENKGEYALNIFT